MEKITIKAVGNTKLYDPERKRFISENGERVPKSQYWLRRVADGGAKIITTAKKEPLKTGTKEETKSSGFSSSIPSKSETSNQKKKSEK